MQWEQQYCGLIAVTYRDGSVRWGDGPERVNTVQWEQQYCGLIAVTYKEG